MARLELQTAFSERSVVKELGARWDLQRKVWYIPEGVDYKPFMAWLPHEDNFNVRASSYHILQTEIACWSCEGITEIFGILLPEGHRVEEQDEDEDESYWKRVEESSVINFAGLLSSSVAERIRQVSNTYNMDYSGVAKTTYWMNHCFHCKSKLGDFNIYREPGGGFYPLDEQSAGGIYSVKIPEPFAALAQVTYGDHVDFITSCSNESSFGEVFGDLAAKKI